MQHHEGASAGDFVGEIKDLSSASDDCGDPKVPLTLADLSDARARDARQSPGQSQGVATGTPPLRLCVRYIVRHAVEDEMATLTQRPVFTCSQYYTIPPARPGASVAINIYTTVP
jgi:hypothetical protein